MSYRDDHAAAVARADAATRELEEHKSRAAAAADELANAEREQARLRQALRAAKKQLAQTSPPPHPSPTSFRPGTVVVGLVVGTIGIAFFAAVVWRLL